MSASPSTGQVVTSVTPQPLSATPVGPTVWILKAPSSNTSTIYIGGPGVSAATGFPMDPGDEKIFDRRPQVGMLFDIAPNSLYVVGTGGVAAWLAFL